jgi:hypothetical protein
VGGYKATSREGREGREVDRGGEGKGRRTQISTKNDLIVIFLLAPKRKVRNTTGKVRCNRTTAAVKCGRAFLGPSTILPPTLLAWWKSVCAPDSDSLYSRMDHTYSRLFAMEFLFGFTE